MQRRIVLSFAALCVALLIGFALFAGAEGADRPASKRAEKQAEMPPVAAEPDAAPLSPEYQMTSHKVVLITDKALNPRAVKLDEGQLVAWISYSPTESVVVFEREVARDMICHSLVNFSLQEDELRSAPIRAGEFASFCQLKPGIYKYKIERKGAPEGDSASEQLEGEIIVGDTPAAKAN